MTNTVRTLGLGMVLASTLGVAAAAEPGQSQEARIEALERQIQALQTDVATLRRQADLAAEAAQAAQAELTALRSGTGVAPVAAEPGSEAETLDALAAAPEDTSQTLATSSGADSAGGTAANAFNPAITLILNGSYAHHSLDPEAYVRSGFPLVGEGGPGENGLSLGESELSLAANIDDKFYGQFTLAVESEDGEDGIGVEEAFIDTTALPNGFALRMGRFYSNIGYLNSHHAHTDSFSDRPLAYQAFLGNQYGDDGVQVRWVAPTSLFFELGGEVFRGQNFPAGGAAQGGLGTRSVFAHLGGAAGSESEWLAGVSMLRTKTEGGEDGFEGDGRLYIADATWKWAPQGNFKDGGVTVRGEYFHEDRDGLFVDPADPSIVADWNGRRRGAYLEAVYRFSRSWDLGYRYDRLWADANGPYASAFDPWRHTAELTWRNSEFSLFRLQLSHDKPNPDDTDNGIVVQYQTSLGAHGAHKF